ncbi:MAG: DinB superfamily protein [Agriterribacter sp.]
MITQHLIPLFQKDLDKLKEEISLYAKDEQLWQIKGAITKSAGNICLQLTGSLQHYIGAVLGDSGYVRNKEAELRVKNAPRSKLLEDIASTKSAVTDALEQLSKNELLKNYPLPVFEEAVTTEYYLIHLLCDLNLNIGQISYHRQILGAE